MNAERAWQASWRHAEQDMLRTCINRPGRDTHGVLAEEENFRINVSDDPAAERLEDRLAGSRESWVME